ncbi:MAG: hypothetical protein LBQ40_01390 [Clostridiales bacterium]|nr:hypothetical protein [Clostridiales bacterium]
MSKKVKMLALTAILAVFSVMALSSCTVVYGGTYFSGKDGKDDDKKTGTELVLEIGGKATVTTYIAGRKVIDVVKESDYKIKDKQVIILDDDGDEFMKFDIVSRNMLKESLTGVEFERTKFFG